MHKTNSPDSSDASIEQLIIPTIGRVVWFYLHGRTQIDADEQPNAALVTYVHGERCVNLAVFDSNGRLQPSSSVTLLQEGDLIPESSCATWMPYQVGQAKKAAAAEVTAAPASFIPLYQQRVIAEEDALATKLIALRGFFIVPGFARLDLAEQGRLEHQAVHMANYLKVLRDRIAAF